MTRVTLVTLVTFVVFVPGCGALGIDFHDRRGDCTPNLEAWRTGDPLHEPYRAKMVRQDGAPPAAVVRFDAEGWGRATCERTSPTGQQTLDRIDARDLNANRTGVSFHAPGRWHVRLSDSSGCVHDFEIEVTPPS